ncbi:GtrA family protein [Streptomyces sp. G5(2025)]|uniref:GtrA family protein n=1 Tax=Streptomyces sp. G5(2025) TaxID=3406628 RepID=UPI003C21C8D8
MIRTRRHAVAFGRFTRYAGLGGGVTVAASAVLVPLSQWLPWIVANALVTVASTVVTTELHARVTFRYGPPDLARHLRSAATVAVGWLVTSGAVAALYALRPDAGPLHQQVVYLCAAGLVGVGRYAALRLTVFVEHRTVSGASAL